MSVKTESKTKLRIELLIGGWYFLVSRVSFVFFKNISLDLLNDSFLFWLTQDFKC